jgi:hypothetical protein
VTWCDGAHYGLKHLIKVDVVSRFSHKYLGHMYVNTKLCVFRKLQDMQLQASCLMRHATRFPRDVLFWFGDKELLPHNFAYKTKLEPQEEARTNELLEQAQQAGLLSMMWNEDDSWAERICTKPNYEVCEEKSMVWVVPHRSRILPMELLYLENKNISKWKFSCNMNLSLAVTLLGFLKYTQRCAEVVITGYVSGGLGCLRYKGKDLEAFLSSWPEVDMNYFSVGSHHDVSCDVSCET